MQVPLMMTFRNVQKSADIEALVRRRAAKLERVCPYLVSCRISVEKPQAHQKSGNPFRVRVDITVPPEHELVTIRNAGEGDLHERLPTVVRRAFDATQRQLKKLVERQRGRVKIHPEQEAAGFVIRLFRNGRYGEYGFIKSLEDVDQRAADCTSSPRRGEEPRGESPIFLSRNRVRITTRSLHSVMDDANHASGSASLTPMYGDFLETLPDSVAHPLER